MSSRHTPKRYSESGNGAICQLYERPGAMAAGLRAVAAIRPGPIDTSRSSPTVSLMWTVLALGGEKRSERPMPLSCCLPQMKRRRGRCDRSGMADHGEKPQRDGGDGKGVSRQAPSDAGAPRPTNLNNESKVRDSLVQRVSNVVRTISSCRAPSKTVPVREDPRSREDTAHV